MKTIGCIVGPVTTLTFLRPPTSPFHYKHNNPYAVNIIGLNSTPHMALLSFS